MRKNKRSYKLLAESNGVVSITVDVEKRFRDSFHNRGDPDISAFLRQLNSILPFHPEDSVDRVYSLDFLHELGATGVINHHFQRWLNAGGLTEDVARHSAIAMTLPFGNDITGRAKKGFDYFGDDNGQMATAYSSRIVAANEEFKLWKSEDTEDAHVEQAGKVVWRNLNISTLGDCACWGATGEEREHVRAQPPTKRLYEMTPHNVDYARASLSLVLGIGALTYHATQYDGQEDVLAHVEWGEPREYPRYVTDTSRKVL